MNRNDKAIKMFLEQRDKKRENVAKARGIKPENATFKSIPASKR